MGSMTEVSFQQSERGYQEQINLSSARFCSLSAKSFQCGQGKRPVSCVDCCDLSESDKSKFVSGHVMGVQISVLGNRTLACSIGGAGDFGL